MQFTTVLLAGFAALASAQTFTGSTVSPTAAAPTGCATTYPGTFELSVVNVTSSSKAKRASSPSSLVISLTNGVLYDNTGRIGYIASNYQFQFDAGGQAGEIYNSGFSVCSNKTLALGGSAIFYQCLSGSFYNLYDRSWAAQCSPIYLEIIPQTSSASASTTVVSQTAASQSAGTAVSKTTTSAAVASTIADGQPQGGSTSAIVSSISVVTSVKSTTSSAAIISTISDHQIQAPTSTSMVVSASTSLSSVAIVSTISDHQIQAPTSTSKVAVVSTISDHQVQAPTSASSVAIVSTISDHQVQAPTSASSVAIVSTISDHQVQAPTTASVVAYTGAAAMPTMAAQVVLAVAGVAIALF